MFFIQFALEWIDFFFLIISSKQLSQLCQLDYSNETLFMKLNGQRKSTWKGFAF